MFETGKSKCGGCEKWKLEHSQESNSMYNSSQQIRCSVYSKRVEAHHISRAQFVVSRFQDLTTAKKRVPSCAPLSSDSWNRYGSMWFEPCMELPSCSWLCVSLNTLSVGLYTHWDETSIPQTPDLLQQHHAHMLAHKVDSTRLVGQQTTLIFHHKKINIIWFEYRKEARSPYHWIPA